MKKKQLNDLSTTLMAMAVMAVVFAGIGFFGFDIWLASTQWLMVAAVLALFGIYTKSR